MIVNCHYAFKQINKSKVLTSKLKALLVRFQKKGVFMNFLEIIGFSYFVGILLSASIIIGFFVIVSKVSAIARDVEVIKNQTIFDAKKTFK